MKIRTSNNLRYFGILFLVELAIVGTIFTGWAIWPSLLPLWMILVVLNFLLMFPLALWLDRRMQ